MNSALGHMGICEIMIMIMFQIYVNSREQLCVICIQKATNWSPVVEMFHRPCYSAPLPWTHTQTTPSFLFKSNLWLIEANTKL